MSFVIEGQTHNGKAYYCFPQTIEESLTFGYAIFNFNLEFICLPDLERNALANVIVLNSPSVEIAKKCIDSFVRYSKVNGRFVPEQYDENRPLDGSITLGSRLNNLK